MHMVQQCSQNVQYSRHGIANKHVKHILRIRIYQNNMVN